METEMQPIRVRMPRRDEVIGEIEVLSGASRFTVRCMDGKTRVCRIPGKFRKKIDIRIGYLVLVKPWDIEPDAKGDIEWIYNKTESTWLRNRGYVK